MASWVLLQWGKRLLPLPVSIICSGITQVWSSGGFGGVWMSGGGTQREIHLSSSRGITDATAQTTLQMWQPC